MLELQRPLSRLGFLFLAAALLALPGDFARAQTQGLFQGEFLLGLRSVDVDGNEDKYKEDVNLEDGGRLVRFGLRFQPAGDGRKIADRVELDIDNLGGEPYETLRFAMRKDGGYELKLDHRKSEYFYFDTFLPPELVNVSLSTGGDFHHFDFERETDSASLRIPVGERGKFRLGFERYERRGESTTTLDIQRDEFEIDRPIDESYEDYQAGFEYSWDKVTLVLEERVREFDNAVELFLPGFSLGESTSDATTLDFFFLDQPYDFTSNQHTVRLLAEPTDRLSLRAAASFQQLDLDVEATERSQGIDFRGNPFTTDLAGGGEVERDTNLLDLDLDYRFSDRAALIAGVWHRESDQDGEFLFGSDINEGSWELTSSGGEVGVQFLPSAQWTLTGGLRFEDREVTHEAETEDSDHEGFFATVAWRPRRGISLTLDAEERSFDDPFTLASPTDQLRLRLKGRFRLTDHWSLNGNLRIERTDNDDSGWVADRDQLTLRLAYTEGRRRASLGYSFVETERSVDQTVVTLPGFGGGQELFFPIFYEADTDFLDGSIRWPLGKRWLVGGTLRFIDNNGSFAVAREDLRCYAEVDLKHGYWLRLGYRTLDYDEDRFDFDDYDARIAELGIGYRW